MSVSGTAGSGPPRTSPGPAVALCFVAECFDAESAALVAGGGGMVLLCGTDAETLAAAAVALRPAGRIGVMIGDPADDQVQAAALAMARELFGQDPVVLPLPDIPQPVDEPASDCPEVADTT